MKIIWINEGVILDIPFTLGVWRRGSLTWIEQEMTAFLWEFWVGMWKASMGASSRIMFKAIEQRISFYIKTPRHEEH